MDEIPQIRIGRGSSNFYTNLIRAYLKNHDKVFVMAGGYRINIAVWICFFIYEEFKVERINTHFLDDLKIQTIFSFQVSKRIGSKLRLYNIKKEYLPILKICNLTSIRLYREHAQLHDLNVIVAAGSMCAKAFFLMSHLYRDGFMLKSIDITKVQSNGQFKAGVRIEVYKNIVAPVIYAQIPETIREATEETTV